MLQLWHFAAFSNTFRGIRATFRIHNSPQWADIAQNSNAGTADLQITGKSLIKKLS